MSGSKYPPLERVEGARRQPNKPGRAMYRARAHEYVESWLPAGTAYHPRGLLRPGVTLTQPLTVWQCVACGRIDDPARDRSGCNAHDKGPVQRETFGL